MKTITVVLIFLLVFTVIKLSGIVAISKLMKPSEKQIEESRRRQRRDDVREVLADKKILLVEDNDLNAEIAMTANAFEEDRKRALEVGMDGYIAKPIHMESVLDALQEGLAGKH